MPRASYSLVLASVAALAGCSADKQARAIAARDAAARAAAAQAVQQAKARDLAVYEGSVLHGPIPPEVATMCDSAAAIVRATLRLELKRQDGSFGDSFQGERRTGCRMTAEGSFKALGNVGPVDTLRSEFVGRRWSADYRHDADGPDGSDFGVRWRETLCLVGGHWDGGDDSDTTTQAPTPEQDRYGITIECAHDVASNHDGHVPEEIWDLAARAGFDSVYAISFRSGNPYVEGDFDGDGVQDAAVVVERRATGKVGIVFIHRGAKKLMVVGAGSDSTAGSDDLAWMQEWEHWAKGITFDTVVPVVPTVQLMGDALWVGGADFGGFLYWTGQRYGFEKFTKPYPATEHRVIIGTQLRRPPN